MLILDGGIDAAVGSMNTFLVLISLLSCYCLEACSIMSVVWLLYGCILHARGSCWKLV